MRHGITNLKELKMIKRFTFSMLALCLFAVAALAQTNTGNLTGTVSDPSGTIQGATVVITDDKTGKEKTVITSDAGGFSVFQRYAGPVPGKNKSGRNKNFPANGLKIDLGSNLTLNANPEVRGRSSHIRLRARA